jgi:hypothetical protein
MAQSLDRQIREHLVRYLSGELSLRDFNRWFMPATWNVDRAGNDDAERLVGDIGLALAELQAGHATEEHVRALFDRLVHTRTTL